MTQTPNNGKTWLTENIDNYKLNKNDTLRIPKLFNEKRKTRRIQTERPEQRPVPHRLLHPEKGPRVAEPSKQKQEGMQKIPTIANDSTRTRGHREKADLSTHSSALSERCSSQTTAYT
jgi:hypothetical protein